MKMIFIIILLLSACSPGPEIDWKEVEIQLEDRKMPTWVCPQGHTNSIKHDACGGCCAFQP